MKKSYIYIIVVLVLLVGSIILISVLNKQGDNYLKEISVSNYESYLNSNETFILYVKQDGCSHCESFTPILKQVLSDNKITAYEINLTSLTTEDKAKFNSLVDISGTPTTVFYKEGEIVDTMEGSKSATFVKSKLDTLGYTK